MTPDCPMSPDDQESTELVCRWMGCGLSFETLEELVSHLTASHVTSQHGGAFFCFWSGCARNKGFNARYKMLIHIRTHTNERPYICSECDKRFSRQENLRIHARTHTGEKPYVCTVPGCGKAYSNSSDRFKHTRTHFVDKPYECRHPGCGKRYTDPSSLRKHVKIYGHSKKTEEAVAAHHIQYNNHDIQDTAHTSVRYEMSPSPSSSGSSLGPSPVPPSSALLAQSLFPTTANSVAAVAAASAASLGAAAGLAPWGSTSPSNLDAVTAAAAWTMALHQYQTGLLLSTGANLGSLSVKDHSLEEIHTEQEEKPSALDLSICALPLDLSLHSSRKRHK